MGFELYILKNEKNNNVQNTLSSPNILFNVNKMFQITEKIKKPGHWTWLGI